MKLLKNDYKIKSDLANFANKNPIGKKLKPFLKNIYKKIEPYIPQPRDFILKKIKNNSICIEVGVYNGVFSERIMRICKPKKLYLIDPWLAIKNRSEIKYSQKYQDQRMQEVENKFKLEIKNKSIEIIRKFSDDALINFEDNSIDFIYIDGDHSYEQVKKDAENFYKKLKIGGIIAFDDYQIPETKKALDEFIRKNNFRCFIKANQMLIKK